MLGCIYCNGATTAVLKRLCACRLKKSVNGLEFALLQMMSEKARGLMVTNQLSGRFLKKYALILG